MSQMLVETLGVTNGLCDVLQVLSVDALMEDLMRQTDGCENMSVTNGLCDVLVYMIFTYMRWRKVQ